MLPLGQNLPPSRTRTPCCSSGFARPARLPGSKSFGGGTGKAPATPAKARPTWRSAPCSHSGRGATPTAWESLFRQSGLYRPKWERYAGAGQTYGARTIATACAHCLDTLDTRRTLTTRKKPGPPDLDKVQDLDRSRELVPASAPSPGRSFPSSIAESMRQLARSCAGSPNSLPGTAFCLLSAALGRTVSVLPKASWREPLIFWHLDIEESGSGKTAPMWLLAEVMKRAQAEAHERYVEEYAAWRALPKDDKHPEPEPAPGARLLPDRRHPRRSALRVGSAPHRRAGHAPQ